jgi:hypothetical protein
MKVGLLVLSLVLLAQTQENFQTRVIFYGSPLDYVCQDMSVNPDKINLHVKFNGTILREFNNLHGQTYCDNFFSKPERVISPGQSWYYS